MEGSITQAYIEDVVLVDDDAIRGAAGRLTTRSVAGEDAS